MSQPAPGWYPDPAGSQRLRWWNGGEWTEQFHDMPQQGSPVAQQMPTDPAAGQYMPAQSQAPIVSALLVVVFLGTMVYTGMQLRAQNLEWQDVQNQRTTAKTSLDQKQDELDKVKKELEEAQK